MERRQRQQALLAALFVVLAAVFVYRYWTAPASHPSSTSNMRTNRAGSATASGEASTSAPQVRLDALNAERPTPVTGERNLFRFKPKPAPPPPSPSRGTATGGVSAPPVPTGPPPPPPIALKFIGVLESPDRSQKIAVLRDDRGVYQGREGDIIEGRYKILKIGVESIDMAYVDGRGRQTIRLTGQ